jgi:ubiquinone/menaquinone biosynthesis C-methylase UbiE
MRIVTRDDFTETYAKLAQRGFGFLASKMRFRGSRRTLSAFDRTAVNVSSWWMVPQVRRRWNERITGEENTGYEDYVVMKYLGERQGLSLLSLGSGSCSHEVLFARNPVFSRVTCVDMAAHLLEKGRIRCRESGLQNMEFLQADAHRLDISGDSYDALLFHASLHHFREIGKLFEERLLEILRQDGILVLNEYVGPDRLQYTGEQLRMVNQALALIPEQYRTRYRMQRIKKRVTGPGILRMVLADPSEARESSAIMDTLERYFVPLELKPYGGNILMPVLKDIAHHFVEETDESRAILERLFEMEDEYLTRARSDFLFGVYRKKE